MGRSLPLLALLITCLLTLLPTIALADISGIPTIVDGDSLKIGADRIRLHELKNLFLNIGLN